ncbi:kinesin heavy chain, putative [Toxoplasma gondii ME49]|uniref:Kinesin heavy chain, putative n=6 Tax=Toxoplasma gondii TaxID=5811 RepID=B6KDN4_TOXGV|nr:kinesin heavy chain, putative [Toxoplasma gondii ME49]EPT28667.1 kinesin heavy chain, putative [Toxoplasma gondii ME49]ESS36010.1 putative kinesin heavy chain [Toxoplasma gondii VEG]KYF46445.1 putative kinesin heavy chain [Toxoplasma gondii ARI]CEL75101.1 TPA: kinesin heavy chain, putative [Toxoplasma gondii VEG]|eukprot:XP_002365957.1 kinesin heavy chain, putative [Toxoplasma gondii ME49]
MDGKGNRDPGALLDATGMDDLAGLDDNKEESIRVCTRMRPLFPKEVEARHVKAWRVERSSLELIVEPPSQLEMEESRQTAAGKAVLGTMKKAAEKSQGQKDIIQRHYVFDRCFDDNTHNSEVFDYVAKDIVLDCFKGINGCVFAYGQTGSGKTHSIMGVADDPGILPRSLAEFFDCVTDPSLLKEEEEELKRQQGDEGDRNGKDDHHDDAETENTEYLMRVSYVEIYLERVNDLLQESAKGGAVENLEVKEDPKRGFVVVGLHEETVATMEEAMSLIAAAEQRRHFARTNFNETSSRSHVVFSITLESTRTFEDGSNISRRGELKIVDLAGNEKAGRASEGVENAKLVMEEGKAINKSLFLLSEVISKLSKQAQQQAEGKLKKGEKEVYIPWRDSKLTRLLQKALGGNSRASVLVAVHPSNMYLDTSFSTLRFALKCKSIKKKVSANFFSPEQSLIAQQKKLILRLQSQLKAMAGAGLFDHLPQRAAQSPENNEEVQQLKIDLEKKINKFQQFIMKATKPTAGVFGVSGTLSKRKTMRGSQGLSGFEGFRRLDTLAAARQNLRTIDKLNSGDIYSGEVSGVSLTKAFGLVARKQANRLTRDGTRPDSYGSLSLGHMDTFEPAIDAAVQELEDIDDRFEEVSSTSEEEEGGGSEPESRELAKEVDWDEAKGGRDENVAGSETRRGVSDEETKPEEAEASVSSRDSSPSPRQTAGKAAAATVDKEARVKEGRGRKSEKKVLKATVRIADDVDEVEEASPLGSPSRVSFVEEKKGKTAGEGGKKKSALKKRSESPEGDEKAPPKSALKKTKKKVTKKKVKARGGEEREGDKAEEKEDEATDVEEELEEEDREQLKEDKVKMEEKLVRLRNEKNMLLEKLKKAKALGLEAVSRLTFRFQTEHDSVKKLQQRVHDLMLQTRYNSVIMNKLGLSVLFTASVPAVEPRPEGLEAQGSATSLPAIEDENQLKDAEKKLVKRSMRFADFLKSFQERGGVPEADRDASGKGLAGELSPDCFEFTSPADAFKGLMFPDIDQVKPLAYAMLNDVLARLMVLQAQASRDLTDDEERATTENSRLLETSLSIMRGEGIPSARTNASENPEEREPLEQIEEILGLAPSTHPPKETTGPTMDGKIKEEDEMYLQGTEVKRQRIVDSVLSLLTPWEQNMLAMLYEQQEMRRALGELRDHFFGKLREMQLRFKRATLERVEFSDHCERLLGALMEFKAELQRRQEKKIVEEDTNAKFGKLMSKIEEMSIQLSERNADFRLLTYEYKELMKRNDVLRSYIDKLKVEKAALLVAPQSLSHYEEINASTPDTTLRSLGYDVCILQRYGSRLFVELEEARAAEAEMRKLNEKLYTELAAANDCVNDLKTHINLANAVHSRTVSGLKTQVADLREELTEKDARIKELEEERDALRKQAAQREGAPSEEEAAFQSQSSGLVEDGKSLGKHAVTADKEDLIRSASDSDSHGRPEEKKKKTAKKADREKTKNKPKAASGTKKTRGASASPTRQVASAKPASNHQEAALPAAAKPPKSRPTGTRAVPGTLSGKKTASPAVATSADREAAAKAEPPKTVEKVSSTHASPPSPSSPVSGKPVSSPDQQAAAAPSAPAVVSVVKAPAFTGDPRDKGFANMAALIRRRAPAS